MTQPERPTRPRRRPTPAADEGRDPIDPIEHKPATMKEEGTPAVTTETPLPTRQELPHAPEQRREATVQLATRISPDVDAVLNAAAARTGYKKRALVEEAIMKTWA